ncbi:translocation/assembly module TamB domain-containing protein [Cellulophaga sp. HaHaR_3_176]|nr:translocation/assembly module TamB domain-containing protein [Cellulophaga sp. HaHaR_3_176]
MLVIIIACVVATLVFSIPFVQTNIASYATNSINKEFGTNIFLDKVKISLITWDTDLKGVYVRDYQKDTLFYINKLNTSILNIGNLIKGDLEFGAIKIEELNFKLKTYKGETTTNLNVFVDKLDDGKPREPGTPPFILTASGVTIENSEFKLIDYNLENSESLNFTNLNINAGDFKILGPDVTADIDRLSFESKRGISVEHMSTLFKYTKERMNFDSLVIETKQSNIKGDLMMDYGPGDFLNFLNKVKFTADFVDSKVAFDEINKLYDQFGAGKIAYFSSNVTGVLNDLTATNLFLTSENTGIRGNFNFKNLFKSKQPFVMEADIRNISTSYYQLRSLMPNLLGKTLPSSFEKLGEFTIRGQATVTENSINSKVNINTAIGSSYSDLELTDIKKIDNASYKGFFSLIDFDLGFFVGNADLGKTSLDFNVEGKGFIKETLNTEVIGEVYAIDFNNYNYKNLKVSGVLKDQLFDGLLVSNDPNIQFTFKGLADFAEEQNNFNFIASVGYADFNKLNFIKDSVSVFKGNVNMDITGNTLDDIIGDIKFSKTSYQNKNDTFYFDDFKISSSFENDSVRLVDINSPDIITGYMKGRFKVAELGRLAANSIGSIYTNYKPYEISSGQNLAFNFKIYNKIVEVFLPEVEFGANTFIKGKIIADQGDFKLIFKSPSIQAYGNVLDSLDIKIDNKNPLFNTYVSVADLSTSYYDVKDFNLINTTLKDTLFFRTEFKGGKKFTDKFNLNFYHTFNENRKSVIGLKKSDVSFKGNSWLLNKNGDKNNKVIFNKTLDSVNIQEIVMNNDLNEQIRLNGQIADSTYKDLELEFKAVSLSKITPTIDSLKLDGRIDGTLHIRQKDKVYRPTSNLEIKDFSVNTIRLGDMIVNAFGNKDLTKIALSTRLTDNGVDKLDVNGSLDISGNSTQADLLATFNSFSLEPFRPLGEPVLSNIRGFVSGNARVQGRIDNPSISGVLNLSNAGIGIPYLNVDYDFGFNSQVVLSDQTFDFQNIQLTDVSQKTKATLNGTINHSFFRDWNLDLNLNTNKDRLLILNTGFEEDVLYYGTGYLNGSGRIYGPTKALSIDVEGKTARGTSLKIPLSDVATIGDYSFINFINKNETKEDEKARELEKYEGLELFFDLDITPDAEVEIIVDPKTKSSLKGTGRGLILMEINTNDKFIMEGTFVVVTGEYNYKFGGFIDKTFSVVPGGTINWEGDPLDAQLNMQAVYALNANPAPLLDNAGYTKRIQTQVIINLKESLEQPDISFDIAFPGVSSLTKSELEYRLQDPTVLDNNAFSLLAQGTFLSETNGGINQQALTGNLIQSASGILNSVIDNNDDNVDIGFSYEQGSTGTSTYQTENKAVFNFATSISDKWLFSGSLGIPVGGGDGISQSAVGGDFELQYLFNEDGNLRAKIFNRENEIQQFVGDVQGYTQGVGLSYQVDFNSFRQLKRKLFARKPKESKIMSDSLQTEMAKDSLMRIIYKDRKNP